MPLPSDVRFFLEQIETALHKLAPRKGLSPGHAPALLWRGAAKDIAPCLFGRVLRMHASKDPPLCLTPGISDLVLFPKLGKCMKPPAYVRPISFLHPCSKLLATILTDPILDDAQQYLALIPQFAYLGGTNSDCRTKAEHIHHKKAGHHFLLSGAYRYKFLWMSTRLSIFFLQKFFCWPCRRQKSIYQSPA